MFELLQMWALVEVLGIVCLPLTVIVFHNLPDRGWAFTKTLSIAVFAFCVWLPLMYFQFLPFSQLFLLGVAFILLACGLVGWWRTYHEIVKAVRSNLTYIVAAEVVFLGMVFLLGWLRSYGPDIRSFEMFMDEGFISAIMRSSHLPPNDMWYAGYSINYYYYAHFTIAVLAKLIGQAPSVAFNTGICIFFGLTAVNLFGVTCNIVGWARYLRLRVRLNPNAPAPIERPDQVFPSLLRAIPFGLLSMIMGLVLGNLAATQQWWLNHGENFHFDWFSPSRVIDKTINEFPAFSFLLSCFHAHVLALAFAVLAIGLIFSLFLEVDGKGLTAFGRGWRLPFTLVSAALVIGGLFTMNGWDYPTYIGLALVAICAQQWITYQRLCWDLLLDMVSASLSLVSLSFILYIPFYINFVSPAQGIGLVGPADRSPLSGELLVYGLFGFVFLSLLIVSAWRRSLFAQKDSSNLQEASRLRIGLICFGALFLIDLLLLLLMKNSLSFLVMGNIAVIALVLTGYHLQDRSYAFILFLGVLAFALVAGCEVLFLKDVFASNFPRMNTVFKFYFQAWTLLSIASGCGFYFILENFRPLEALSSSMFWLRRSIAVAWSLSLVLLFIAALVYPLLATPARYARTNYQTNQTYWLRSNSLDGMSYLKDCHPPECSYVTSGDYEAISWLNANVQGDPGIIEAIGDDYSFYGRVSAFTGLPDPMGWIGHEYQWRINWMNRGNNGADFNSRSSDVGLIYNSAYSQVVLTTMARYHAQYLYVGPLEYLKYPGANLQRFASFMQVVYNANGVTIYKIK